MYVKNALTLADAKQIAGAAEAEALKNNWRVTIAVLDDGGNLLFLQRLDEAPLGSIVVAQEKARTALLFKRPTKVFEEIIASGRTAMLTLPGATPIEGGLPLLNNGQIIGAIGVSACNRRRTRKSLGLVSRWRRIVNGTVSRPERALPMEPDQRTALTA